MSEGQTRDARPDRLSTCLRARFDPIAVILSPPRCGSTVLARALWQHRAFRCYLHEPYDRAYHDGLPATPQVMLDSIITRSEKPGHGKGIVIKEMTFQVAGRADDLIDAATLPVILLIRDPRLAVSSRMRCRAEGGEDPWFPDREAGWRDLAAIQKYLQSSGTDYAVVDISDVRRDPPAVLAGLCERLGLAADPSMLSWEPASRLRLGQLDGRQDHWYQRVLASTRFEQPSEVPPEASYFRDRRMLSVVRDCMAHYQRARADLRFVGLGLASTAHSRCAPDRAASDRAASDRGASSRAAPG